MPELRVCTNTIKALGEGDLWWAKVCKARDIAHPTSERLIELNHPCTNAEHRVTNGSFDRDAVHAGRPNGSSRQK